MEYKISQLASWDLENIWLYTYEKWSVEQADKYLNLLMTEIEHLALNPDSGTDFNSLRKGYFRSKIKSHFIFYRIDDTNQIVEVIRILHQRMDIENRLLE